MFKKLLVLMMVLGIGSWLMATVYSSGPINLAIPDNIPAGVNSTISVPGAGGVLGVKVGVDITHTWIGDVIVSITHGGTTVQLFNRFGSLGDNMTGTIYDDAATTPIASGTAPFTGSFIPVQPISVFICTAGAGDWVLNVSDNAGADLGTLNSWYVDLNLQATGAPDIPTTPVPANSAINVLLTTTQLSWVFGTGTQMYDLKYGTTNPPTTLVVTNQTAAPGPGSWTITPPVNGITQYYWQVIERSTLTGLQTDGPVWNFTTQVAPVTTFPFTQTFSPWPPLGWDLAGGTFSWVADAVSGSAEALYWSHNAPSHCVMTTPPLVLNGAFKLNFDWSHLYNATYPNDQLVISASGNNGGTWTEIWNIAGTEFNSNDGATNTLAGSFVNHEIVLNAFAGQTVLIKFDGISGYGPNLFIDNVIVSTNEAGTIAGNVTAGGNPLAGATVTFTSGATVVTTTTDAAGLYSQLLPIGTYTVVFSKLGYSTVTTPDVVVANLQTIPVNAVLVLLPMVTVQGRVEANTALGVGIVGATINLTGYAPFTATTNASGNFTITGVYASQTYNYTVAATGFQPSTGTVVVGTSNVDMGTLLVTEVLFPASQVVATDNGATVGLTWAAPNPNAITVTDGFETYTDFALSFAPWTCVDVDGSGTYAITGYTWEGQFDPQAYMIFNPSSTSPALATGAESHSGAKYAACFASTSPPNNDWLITPQVLIPGGGVFKFWARSYVPDYGLERFKVGVSTTGTLPANFTIISGASYIEAPVAWTEYSYDLSAYATQQVYLGINCLSNDAFIMFIDDVLIGNDAGFISFAGEGQYLKSAPVQPKLPTSSHALRLTKDASKAAAPTVDLQRDEDRPVIGYRVFRLHVGEETTPDIWAPLTPATVTALSFTDEQWAGLPTGDYKWAVKAEYTGGALSAPAISNHINKFVSGTMNGNVTSFLTGLPVNGATVTAGTYTATTNAAGAYTISLPTGTYTVTCVAGGFETATTTNVVVNANPAVTTVNFQLNASSIILSDGFETYTDFALAFDPWILNDVDGAGTYGMTGTTWPGSSEPQAFIVFNPTTTVPAIATGGEAHGGTKYAACFAATTPPNNDWLIARKVHIGDTGSVSFWARSFVSTYGLERFKVGISTTGTLPANFTIVSPAPYVQAPVAWTQYTYDLASYAGQDIYVGINCVSNDAFIMFVDDVEINSPGGYIVANSDIVATPTLTSLEGNYPNPFNPTTYIKYSVKQTTPVTIDIYNVKGQKVKTLVNEVVNSGIHTAMWNGTDDNNRSVGSGVYFYKMNAGKYSSTKKMIMMK